MHTYIDSKLNIILFAKMSAVDHPLLIQIDDPEDKTKEEVSKKTELSSNAKDTENKEEEEKNERQM